MEYHLNEFEGEPDVTVTILGHLDGRATIRLHRGRTFGILIVVDHDTMTRNHASTMPSGDASHDERFTRLLCGHLRDIPMLRQVVSDGNMMQIETAPGFLDGILDTILRAIGRSYSIPGVMKVRMSTFESWADRSAITG